MKAVLRLDMPKGCYCCPLLDAVGDGVVKCRGAKELNWRGELVDREFKYGQNLEVRQAFCPLEEEIYFNPEAHPELLEEL